ncbi:phage tail assembly chaperone, partial [Acinetobacter baumannii]|uniref:phage tail assembly chaperone n=1 Tax=Acinetobacter baumannii TaxID=470 RepID=UPI003672BE91
MATKPKFSLTLAPTFKCKVAIPVPGDKSADIEFIFKGRSREAFKDFIESLKDRDDADV